MSVVFRGRLVPNIQPNPNEPLEIRFVRPNNTTGVTIQIKELDTYRATDGTQVNEESDDDLLATFTGRIVNRRFQVENHTNASDNASLPTIKIKFQGTDTEYSIPVVQEAGESEGTNWEIAFTVQKSGQSDYNSPVSFIRRSTGRALIVDNTMGDLSEYEGHANLVRNYFVTNGFESNILRGAASQPTLAHYSAANTTDYRDGFDRDIFLNEASNYNYIYFNCHGDINLEGLGYNEQSTPCLLCESRFRHNQFTTCNRDGQCNRVDRGYHLYKLRTSNNAQIRLTTPAGTSPLQSVVMDWDLEEIVGKFVRWDEYDEAFGNANTGDANVSVLLAGPPPTHEVNVPNDFQFPTLLAFSTGPLRPDFREDHLQVNAGVRVQDPESTYLHAGTCEAVPGVPVICFNPLGTPLSSEVNATPTAAAGTPAAPTSSASPTVFSNAPSNLTAVAANGQVRLCWDEVSGAETYTLYRGTAAGVDESNSHVINRIFGNSFDDTGLTNGTQYFYKVRARRAGKNNLSPDSLGSTNLSSTKLVYAGCCLSGRKKALAEAFLDAGAKFFIGHQVVTASNAERLINRFWERWLRGGAILRNVIHVFNRAIQSSPGPYRRTRPVVYYKDDTDTTRFWRSGMALPDPDSIKVD